MHKRKAQMDIVTHHRNDIAIAEVISSETVIQNADDALDLMGNVYYQGFDRMIVHETNITPDFFDLKNKMAGDILQKFSNYRIRLAIVGDFSKFTSKSLRDFIYESNQGKQVCFVGAINEALDLLSR